MIEGHNQITDAHTQLFGDLVKASFDRNFKWGAGEYLRVAMHILSKASNKDLHNNQYWKDVANEFRTGVSSGLISLCGKNGMILPPSVNDLGIVSMPLEYRPSFEAPAKDLMVCIVHPRVMEITRTGPDTYEGETAVIAISDAVRMLHATPENRRALRKDIPDEYFRAIGLLPISPDWHE